MSQVLDLRRSIQIVRRHTVLLGLTFRTSRLGFPGN